MEFECYQAVSFGRKPSDAKLIAPVSNIHMSCIVPFDICATSCEYLTIGTLTMYSRVANKTDSRIENPRDAPLTNKCPYAAAVYNSAGTLVSKIALAVGLVNIIGIYCKYSAIISRI